MKVLSFYIFLSLLSISFCSIDYATNLINGIIGKISHLYTHQCLSNNYTYSTNIFGSCSIFDGTLLEIRYLNSNTNFYILSYNSNSSYPNILYTYNTYSYFISTNSYYCLGENFTNDSYYNNYSSNGSYYSNYSNNESNYSYCSYTPGDEYKFYANFTQGNTRNPLGSFTLKNIYYQKCYSVDIKNGNYIGYSFKACDPDDLTQIFRFKIASSNLLTLQKINLTAALETSKNRVKFTWSNPNKLSNVTFMIVPKNQSVSDQGKLNLQNVKCSSRNSFSPIAFIFENNNISITVSVDDMEACNIKPESDYYQNRYEMKLIHVFSDDSLGFSRNYQIYFQNQIDAEQIAVVGEYSDANESQLFESSSVDYIELSNLISINFIQSINQTYLPRGLQNFTISVNALSNYKISFYDNFIYLYSVNASNNYNVITQTLPIFIYKLSNNEFNVTFDLSNITSNYYKFRIRLRLTRLTRILESTDNQTYESTLAEYNSQETYYIGTNTEIQDLIYKVNSNNNKKNTNQESKDITTIVALSVALSIVLFVFFIAILIWKRGKWFVKKEKKENDPNHKELEIKVGDIIHEPIV